MRNKTPASGIQENDTTYSILTTTGGKVDRFDNVREREGELERGERAKERGGERGK